MSEKLSNNEPALKNSAPSRPCFSKLQFGFRALLLTTLIAGGAAKWKGKEAWEGLNHWLTSEQEEKEDPQPVAPLPGIYKGKQSPPLRSRQLLG